MGTNDLEERLICFAVRVIKIAESVQKTYAGLHLSGQLIKPPHQQRLIMEKLKVQNQGRILSIK